MRLKVAAAIALLMAMAATTASAGVIISENVATSVNGAIHKTAQTVMIQGNKRKVIAPSVITITDLDAGRMYLFGSVSKRFDNIPLPPPSLALNALAKQGISVELKKVPGTGKVAGYECQDYAGSQRLGRYNFDSTQCVATTAPGAHEYVAFTKGFAAKLKGTPIEPKGEIPDGIPVSSKVSMMFIPFPIPKNFPPDLTAKVKASNAKLKPEITQTTVTKIQVKDIAASEFEIPAEYRGTPGPPMKFQSGVPGGPNPPKPMPSMVLPESALKALQHGTPAAQPTH